MGKIKSYKVDTDCKNCKGQGYYKIPMGEEADNQLSMIECKKCGCIGYLSVWRGK